MKKVIAYIFTIPAKILFWPLYVSFWLCEGEGMNMQNEFAVAAMGVIFSLAWVSGIIYGLISIKG
jgi:Zn-dependent protease